MGVDPDSYDDILTAVEKQYSNVVFRGDEYDNPTRIPFKSPSLNWATQGGIPQGRFSRFYGQWSSAKSKNAWDLIANAQAMGLTCAYYNIEKQYHSGFAEEQGVDIGALKVIHSSKIEEVGAICESLFGAVHFHVFDSCSAAAPMDALAADVEEWQRGLKPRVWNKVFDRLIDKIDDSENTVLYIDQVRINQSTQSEEPPGGKQMEHASSLTIQFKRGSWLFRTPEGYLTDKKNAEASKTFSGQMEPEGMEIKARIHKSRVCRPNRTATLRLDYNDMQFDTIFELARAGLDLGIIRQPSNGRYVIEDQSGKDLKFHGKDKLYDFIKGDVTLQEEIEEELMRHV